ncbi:MAG TPA: GNAT family N-acetyltransferase [Acidimicrobiales bacterium]|nr:GNAT family N-acetyltransferase [Acidimicrobiales bacterium]
MIEVRRAEVEDLDDLADVLGAAFADYPWTRWTVDGRDHVRRITALQRLALEHLGLPYGDVWIATVDDVIQSVAVWMDSAVTIPDSATAAIAAEQAGLEGDRHAASAEAEAQTQSMRPEGRHYCLAAVATLPSAQRQGLATRVIAPGLAHSEAAGLTAYLETSAETNVQFYEDNGFEVTCYQRIAGDGPPVWAMTRDPPRRHDLREASG